MLVGNFGDGSVSVYDTSGNFVGTLANAGGQSLINAGLWGLTFGNGGNGGLTTSLYIAAGTNNETDGLFARIDLVPEPGVVALGGIALLGIRRRR